MNLKKFLVEAKNGKREWRLVRQMAHDPQYTVGSKIPGLGRVVLEACAGCGRFEEYCYCKEARA